MTRDTQRLHDDRELVNNAEVYAALWATGPFPRLPEDSPNELKNLVIDIDDPKRLYTIHRASRRYYFQLLVERYIIQIRYGCQSKACTTATCFSCRKRLAGGAPVRRYNATSARTLAVYMASLDNPEKGLCHNTSAELPTPPTNKLSKPSRTPYNGLKVPPTPALSSGIQNEDGHTPKTITANGVNGLAVSIEGAEKQITPGDSKEKRRKKATGQDLDALKEPHKTDHRSFVQNVFGTVAFKMLEWLTPRNLEMLVKLDENPDIPLKKTVLPPEEVLSAEITPGDILANSDDTEEASSYAKTDSGHNIDDEKILSATESKERSRESSGLLRKPNMDGEGRPNSPAELKSSGRCMPQRRKSHVRTVSDTLESRSPKRVLNRPLRPTESGTDTVSFSQGNFLTSQPKQILPRQARIASPKLHAVVSSPLIEELKVLPPKSPVKQKTKAVKVEDQKNVEMYRPSKNERREKEPKRLKGPRNQFPECTSPPQSLSYLPIEIIDFLCDITQASGTCEKHSLQPEMINDNLKRRREKSIPLSRSLQLPTSSQDPSTLTNQWRLFIEQSLFDVLGKPDSLLRSFRHEDNRLFDTQTMWYLMLRMTRVAPSLVFDCLWNTAGSLFRPSQKLEAAYEWAKEFGPQTPISNKAISNFDAAQVVNISLHALVAAAPLIDDSRQMANMSRIRSYGSAMQGRDSSSLEPAALCLQYEDAFTNDLALRLARRLFAAIPVRRRFTELLDLQRDVQDVEKSEPDILETILETLKFLDLGTPPILDFSENERDLHEKRAPTLILDWARTVMLQCWEGSAEVPNDGPFGGALATMAAIYNNRKSLLLGDIHFRTEYFAERLDPIAMPLQWLSFESNRRTAHLLDYPYLFNPSTLITYFRAINFSRMNRSFESAKATFGLMYSTMAENSLMTDKARRDKLHDRLRVATSRFMVLEIRRSNVLVDTFNSIWRREERELLRPLKLRLGEEGGEEGSDSGGVQQEFFRLAIAEALDPKYGKSSNMFPEDVLIEAGTFTIDSGTKMTWFQPGSPEPLWKFELIGMIVSLAVYNGLTLPVTFPKALYRKLLDEDVTELHHIADGWPDLANSLTILLEWDENKGLVEDIFTRTYEFSVEQFGQPVSREMSISTQWPQFSDPQPSSGNPADAPLVTNENRNSYVSDYIRWLTDVSIRPQFEAFKTGFFTCIDRRSVTLFDPDTLQSVVEGVQEINITELRRATRYVGWEASNACVRGFWSIVKRFDFEQKKKLLEFVTASDRVPVGGMPNLQFTLQRSGDSDERLPSSYTCYGILLLPEYSTKEILREKLAMALENSKGFGNA